MHFVRRDFNGTAAIGKAIGHVHLLELGDNRAAVLIGQIAEQRAVVRLFCPQYQRHDDRDGGGAGHH